MLNVYDDICSAAGRGPKDLSRGVFIIDIAFVTFLVAMEFVEDAHVVRPLILVVHLSASLSSYEGGGDEVELLPSVVVVVVVVVRVLCEQLVLCDVSAYMTKRSTVRINRGSRHE